jgi:anaerobic magnesium-protoporphyrin IX monomethyl ester cyclase
MNDRKLRTIGLLSLITGTLIVLVIMLLYQLEVPEAMMIPILMAYGVLQFRFASILFNWIYKSKLIDLPKGLREKFPPPSIQLLDSPCDVILLRPPSAVLSGPDCGEALGLGYLASVLRKEGYQTVIIDERLEKLDVMQAVELIIAYNPKALGINLNFQYLAPVTQELIETLRDRNYTGHITLGGLYASVAAEVLMEEIPGVDTIVRFEGEVSYLELIKNLDRKLNWPEINGLVFRNDDRESVVNPLRSLIPDLGTVPMPARDHLDLAIQLGGYAYIISSRGCRGKCAYCVQSLSVSQPSGSRWRGRDPVDVVDEMEQAIKSSGARLFSFVDDDIFGPTKDGENNAHRLARTIIDRGLDVSVLTSVQPKDVKPEVFALLKKAGFASVILAVDNFSQNVLNRYQKYSNLADNFQSIEVLDNLGIDAYLGIIMFDPQTTLEELAENFQSMMGINHFLRPWQILSKLEVYHGSTLTLSFEEKGLLEKNGYFATYNFVDERVDAVYHALENIITEAFPAISQLDQLRWGNINYSDADQKVLDYCRDDLKKLMIEYNQEILSFAMGIVNIQSESDVQLSVSELAGDDLLDQARILSNQMIYKLDDLRSKAKEYAEIEEEKAEMLESYTTVS